MPDPDPIPPQPVADPAYWRDRLRRSHAAVTEPPYLWPHTALFVCPPGVWREIEERHREILERHVEPAESVFDAGCGWGRLISLMPRRWYGWYVGVDLSPDMLRLARRRHPHHAFMLADLRDLSAVRAALGQTCDWAVLVSVRQMVTANLGAPAWAEVERELRTVARRFLVLEYDPDDEGTVL